MARYGRMAGIRQPAEEDPRRREISDAEDEGSGDAFRDGYTCFAERPRSAAAGNFLPEEEADAFDRETDMMAEWGGPEYRRARRRRDPQDDDGSPPNSPY